MYHKWQSYDVWFLKYGAPQTEFFIILDYFLPFYPSNKLENQNYEKMEKQKTNKQTNTLGDIIFLHMCNINENHMICGFWDMGHNWQKFLSFWTIFCHFTPLTSWTIKIMRKLKKNTLGDIFILHMCTINENHDLWILGYGARDRIFVIEPFFALLPH